MENVQKNITKKPEPENPVEVCIYSHSMIVTFNDVDIDEIQEFILFIDAHSCKYEQAENEFEITGNMDTLYNILLYITFNFEDVCLY